MESEDNKDTGVEDDSDVLGNAKRDVRANRYKLEEECSRQSSLYLYYSDVLTEAKDAEIAADDALDKVLAQVELRLRDSPPEGMKVTDATIKALVGASDEVDAARVALRKAKKWRGQVENVVNALGHKKSSLDNLVVLWSKGYYMTDTGTPRTGTDEASDAIRSHLNRGGRDNE